MTGAVLLLLAAAGESLAPAMPCRCPCAAPTSDEHPFRRPSATAFDLNRAGRELYRTRRWEEARAQYRAALQADPAFLAPHLNIACSFAQEERFGEAVAEAARLAERQFVPWSRQIREAADLAPLHGRPERQTLERALAEAGRRWGAELSRALLFVARRAPPVRLPASGVLTLGLEQEILAWLPDSGAYRQVTAEEGRVLGFVQSPDRQTVVYVRAGRLVREPGRAPRLRALTLRRLDLPTMALGPAVPVAPDVVELRIELAADGAARLTLDTGETRTSARFDGDTVRAEAAAGPGAVGPSNHLRITARGVATPARESVTEPCRFTAEDMRDEAGRAGIRIRAPRARSFTLDAPQGAGLRGLAFP
jgi:hypothetical protein